MIEPGRTRQEGIILKSPIWLKLGRKIECHQHIHVLKHKVKIFHFTRVMGKTGKNGHFGTHLCILISQIQLSG